MDKLLEALAELEHEQWMAWAETLMATEQISFERQQRWCRYMVPYAELSEDVKEHDRKWARKVLAIVEERIKELEESNKQLEAFYKFERRRYLELGKHIEKLEEENRKLRAALQECVSLLKGEKKFPEDLTIWGPDGRNIVRVRAVVRQAEAALEE
jgi:chromosome segregation ATPase